MNKTKRKLNKRIEALVNMHRSSGFSVDQDKISELIEEFEPYKNDLIPNEKEEHFELVSSDGERTGVSAPRWLCHLVGLRHSAAHIALQFKAQDIAIMILQVRSWTKSDSPGHLDISVGGHVKSGSVPLETAWAEMSEEIGFKPQDLVEGNLRKIFDYPTYNSSGPWFHNIEWCEVFTGEIKSDSINKLRFADGEVVGMYLCPESELSRMLKQKQIPIAPGLRNFIIHKDGNS